MADSGHGNTNHRQDNALLVLALTQAGQLLEVLQADELLTLKSEKNAK